MSSFWNRWGEHAERMRAAAIAHPALLQRLADAPDKTFHVYAIRLGALLAAEPDAGAGEVAAAFEAGTLTELIEAAWGACPQGTMSALERCGADVHYAAFYARLREVLTDARLGTVLRSSREPIDARLLEHIDETRRTDPVFDAAYGVMSGQQIQALDWLVRRLRADGVALDDAALARRLARYPKVAWPNLVRHLLLMHPGMAAPWAGSARMRPLQTPRDLVETGRRMRNCLGETRFAVRLLRGTDAFYAWNGDERAVVQIGLLGRGEWDIVEWLGVDNELLSPATYDAITREMVDARAAVGSHLISRLLMTSSY